MAETAHECENREIHRRHHEVGDDTPAAIRLESLGYSYRGSISRGTGRDHSTASADAALDGVSLDVAAGEIFGVLGPNGSGKTTLFRILATMMRPTHGRASVFGDDVAGRPHQVRAQLGVVFQQPSVDLKLTAWENMIHQGRLYGLRGPELRERAGMLLERFGLLDRRRDLIETFSGGMRRRLEVAKAMLHDPCLLLLDEPETGLDPAGRRDLWKLLESVRAQRNVTVALTTHLMEQAQRCDRLAILNRGRLIALDSPAGLTGRIGAPVIRIEPATGQDAGQLRDAIEQRFGPWTEGAVPTLVGGTIRLQNAKGAAFAVELSAAFGERIQSTTIGRATLEDVFLHLTGHTLLGDARRGEALRHEGT